MCGKNMRELCIMNFFHKTYDEADELNKCIRCKDHNWKQVDLFKGEHNTVTVYECRNCKIKEVVIEKLN